jgi:hypothetical protein
LPLHIASPLTLSLLRLSSLLPGAASQRVVSRPRRARSALPALVLLKTFSHDIHQAATSFQSHPPTTKGSPRSFFPGIHDSLCRDM